LWLGFGLLSLCWLRLRWRNGLRMSRHGRWSRLRLLHRSRRCYPGSRDGHRHHMLSRDRYGCWRRLCRHWRGRDFGLCRCWCRFRRRHSLGVRRGRGSGRLWLRPRRSCGRRRFRLRRGFRLLSRFWLLRSSGRRRCGRCALRGARLPRPSQTYRVSRKRQKHQCR
jgi:hypothetical protein